MGIKAVSRCNKRINRYIESYPERLVNRLPFRSVALADGDTTAITATMLLGVYALLFVLLTIYIANKVYLSPLSKIPASHWSARFSPIWSLWVRYRGTELSELVKAHRKHGPIVQVGPHDISISSYQDGIRKVYDAGFGKPSQFYSFFNYYGLD